MSTPLNQSSSSRGRRIAQFPRPLTGFSILMLPVIACTFTSRGRADDSAARRDTFEILWQTPIGSWSGSPVVHNHLILIGTNNNARRDPAVRDNRGVVMCFKAASGEFLGQVTHTRLPHRSNDLPGLGICCRPCVEENRAY